MLLRAWGNMGLRPPKFLWSLSLAQASGQFRNNTRDCGKIAWQADEM